ncbi:hypothetical protein R2R35_07500 [Anaerocolumna sp. AGMB13020]|nr:hypothetical protein [Anaerocolumna sp. AGMB13020]WOO38339.1 hypothetical protein R2R35_07500 [Anaerocolumna sp. AGMB13020]
MITINGAYTSATPFADRRFDEISEVIQETVTINKIIRPVYHFKASGN